MAKKGVTNNPHGRPRGSQNLVTKELRAKLKVVIETELEALPELLAGVEPIERLGILVRLLPYALPKVDTVPPGYDEPLDWDGWS